ncbi:hypothetical protein Tco_0791834 [Tanacetum coccineum]
MMKGSDIGIQEKKAKLFNEWERFTSTDRELIESYYHRFSKLMNDFKRNKHFSEKIASNLKFLNNLQPEWKRHVTIVHQTKDLHENGIIVIPGIANQNANQIGNGNVVAAQAEGNANGNNGDLDKIEEVNANCILMANLQQASTSGTQTDKASVYDSYGSAESVYQEQCLTKKINALHLSSAKTITTLNEEIANLNNMLSKKKSTVSSLQEEKKRLKFDFKIREDEFLDKQILLENKIKELDNILVKTEAAKFIRDFKSLTNKADESLAKHKALEFEFERLLRAVLERTKERFENCIIKKENEYAKLWNDWYKKCEECKYDKISYDKAHNDIQQKIEWLQAQLGDLKGKSKDSTCASDTLDPLSQKLENENVELEFQVLNYLREIEHLKTTYKNLFDSISMTRAQTKSIIDPLQDKLHDMIYENAKLRAQLFDKASEQKDTTKGTSANTKFANQSILGRPFLQPLKNNFVVRQPNAFQSERLKFSNNRVPQKVDKSNDLSKPVTSNSVPTTKESKVVKNDNVIAPGMFRINPHNTAKTIRPQPRSNTKNDRVPSTSKNRCIKNKEVEVEEHHRNLLLFKNKKHMSSESNNIKLAIRNDKSEVVCAMCKQYLITTNHDVCVLNYVNGMNSHKKNQKANVSNTKNKKKQKPQVWKPKKVRSKERLASPKPRKPRTYLRWSPTGRIFDLKGKIIESSDAECHSDYSNGNNACTSNPREPIRKRFPNSTFSLAGHLNMFMVRRLGMLKAHDRKSEASHKFRLKVIGNRPLWK